MTKTQIILDKLHHAAMTTAELIEEIIPDYYALRDMYKRSIGQEFRRPLSSKEKKRLEEKTFYTLLSRLKNDGLVGKSKGSDASVWHITKRGRERLTNLQEVKKCILPHKIYSAVPDDQLRIVIFDIPESFRYIRDWLRITLEKLGFSLLQKSVWIGKQKIPEEFLYDLRELNMLRYVHIFAVSKKGSITSSLDF